MRLKDPVPASLSGCHQKVAEAGSRCRRRRSEREDEGAELLLAGRRGIDVVGLGHHAVHLDTALGEHLPDCLGGFGISREAVVGGVEGQAEPLRVAGLGEELLRPFRIGGGALQRGIGAADPVGHDLPCRLTGGVEDTVDDELAVDESWTALGGRACP